MTRPGRVHLHPSTWIALVAIFLALGGSAFALKKGSVDEKALSNNAVKSKNIKNGQVKTKDVKPGKIADSKIKDGTVGTDQLGLPLAGSELSDGSISTQALAGGIGDAKLSNITVFGDGGFVTAEPFSAAGENAARNNAPEIPLWSGGPFEIYAKCFIDTSGPAMWAETFIRTSEAGALLSAPAAFLPGGSAAAFQFFNPSTGVMMRRLMMAVTGADAVAVKPDPASENSFVAVAPDRSIVLQGKTLGAVKYGDPPGDDGIYGNSDVCLFGGHVTVG